MTCLCNAIDIDVAGTVQNWQLELNIELFIARLDDVNSKVARSIELLAPRRCE